IPNPIDILNGTVKGAGDIVRGALGLGPTKSNASSKSQFRLDDFKGEVLGKGLAEDNRFEMFIGIPPCLTTWGQYMQGSIIRIESVSFPPLSLYVKQRRTYGAAEPMPVSADYGGEAGLTVTFLIDRDMNTKKMFDAWMDSIVDTDSQTVSYPDSYTTMLGIHQLDRTDGSVYETVIRDAFPKSLGAMTVSQNAQGNFMRLPVTFGYRKWICHEVASQKSATQMDAASLAAHGGDVVKSVNDQIRSRATALQ